MVVTDTYLSNNHLQAIHMSSLEGDRSRVYERNKDPKDIPLVICYNMGSDFHLRTEQEQKERVLAMVKMLRVALNEVLEDVGGMMGRGR